jgi:hypothetical protein
MLSAVNETSFRHYLKMLVSQSKAPVPDPDGYMEKPPEPDALLQLARTILARQAPPAA